MGKAPADQFYWGDYLNDVELQTACSASRGIWTNALCRMWFSKIRGELKGKKDIFPGLLICTIEEFEVFLKEAKTYEFCNLTIDNEHITIQNRRMMRDERERQLTRKRQSRFREKGGGSPENWIAIRVKILERDKYMCAYCGKKATTVDHIFPKSKGGTEDFSNLVGCCKTCNIIKNNRTLEEAEMSFWKGYDQKKLKYNAKITPPSSSSSLNTKIPKKEHFVLQKTKQDLDKICEQISKKLPKKLFNPYQFANANKKSHPGAILHTLNRILKEGERLDDPWGYAVKILTVEHQNYNEKDAMEQGERYKKELVDFAREIERKSKT